MQMTVHNLEIGELTQAEDLQAELRVSLWGIQSRRLYRRLCRDAIAGRIAAVVANDGNGLAGIALCAPRSYVYTAVIGSPLLLWDLVRVRFGRSEGRIKHAPAVSVSCITLRSDTPAHTWADPGPAWRILFIGVRAQYRRRGLAGALYAALAPGRPLVARVGSTNTASLIMHQNEGWLMYPDEGCVLAVRPLGRSDLAALTEPHTY